MAAPADVDLCELHLTVKDTMNNYIPYIDPKTGITSMDLPYESLDYIDEMYEARQQMLSSAKVVFPSLIARPELQGILSQIKKGDRVEIYNFQPDCGSPVFGGFIPANGLIEQDGKLQVDILDTLVQGQWQHIRRIEYQNTNADGFYRRAMSRWVDIVNEDFTASPTTIRNAYAVPNEISITSGQIRLDGGTPFPSVFAFGPPIATYGEAIVANDAIVVECDATLNYVPGTLGSMGQIGLGIDSASGGGFNTGPNGSSALFRASAAPERHVVQTDIRGTAPAAFNGTVQPVPLTTPRTFHLTVLFQTDSTNANMTITVFVDNIQMNSRTFTWFPDAQKWGPSMTLVTGSPGNNSDYVIAKNWRARKLKPWIDRAATFNPQLTDNLTYQPNHEENLQFLQFTAERDGTEFRAIYKTAPTRDQLELNLVSSLGVDASATVSDRLKVEEGWNVVTEPKNNAKANVYSNDVIRMGASTVDIQNFSERYSIAEVGNPILGYAAKAPYMEQITNDDRGALQSLVDIFAKAELIRRTDTVPSLELEYAEQLEYAFKYRAGDKVNVSTQSLLANQDRTSLRIMRLEHRAGSPIKRAQFGHLPFDPSMMKLLAESMKIQWLYEQAGTNPGLYVYPYQNIVITAGADSTDFIFYLDKFVTGTSIAYASLHWVTEASCTLVKPVINDNIMNLTNLTPVSSTDTGLYPVTMSFQEPGRYKLHFRNTDTVDHTLVFAVLVLKIKG